MASSKEHQPEESIPLPNLQDPVQLNGWLDKYIHTHLRGYEDLTHGDGRKYSEEEAVQATRGQYFRWAQEYLNDPDVLGVIKGILMRRATLNTPIKTR